MKYACLIYGDGNLEDPLPAIEMDALLAETLAYHEELRRQGHFIIAHPSIPRSPQRRFVPAVGSSRRPTARSPKRRSS